MKRSLPPWTWLVLAALSFTAALASWPGPRGAVSSPQQLRVPTVETTPQPVAADTAADAANDAAAPPAAPTQRVPAPVVLDESDQGMTLSPQAGRQVLRCVEKGRTVYRDAGTACAEGGGEQITLFPTRGVESRR